MRRACGLQMSSVADDCGRAIGRGGVDARAASRYVSGYGSGDVPLLIDTGADVRIVPRSAAEVVDADVRPSDVAIRFFDGSEAACDVAELTIVLLRYRFRGAFVLGDEEYGVLGRNILNLLALTLDGPRRTWSA